MRKSMFVLVMSLVVAMCSVQDGQARARITYGNGPEFQELQVLPDSVEIDGCHVNYGVTFEQFSLFTVPIWNYGTVEYALFAEDNNTIYSMDDEDLAYLVEEYKVPVGLTTLGQLSFWNKIGGKLVVLAVLLIFGAIYWFTKHNRDQKEEQDSEQQAKDSESKEV